MVACYPYKLEGSPELLREYSPVAWGVHHASSSRHAGMRGRGHCRGNIGQVLSRPRVAGALSSGLSSLPEPSGIGPCSTPPFSGGDDRNSVSRPFGRKMTGTGGHGETASSGFTALHYFALVYPTRAPPLPPRPCLPLPYRPHPPSKLYACCSHGVSTLGLARVLHFSRLVLSRRQNAVGEYVFQYMPAYSSTNVCSVEAPHDRAIPTRQHMLVPLLQSVYP